MRIGGRPSLCETSQNGTDRLRGSTWMFKTDINSQTVQFSASVLLMVWNAYKMIVVLLLFLSRLPAIRNPQSSCSKPGGPNAAHDVFATNESPTDASKMGYRIQNNHRNNHNGLLTCFRLCIHSHYQSAFRFVLFFHLVPTSQR